MYNNNQSSNSGRDRFAQPPRRFGNGSGGGNGGGYGGRNNGRSFGGRGRRGPQESTIDERKFVSKAVTKTEQVEHVAKWNYADLAVDSKLRENILQKGYTMPTPIQEQIISHVMEGKDVLGVANTGTGKTAAFLIPMIEKVLKSPTERVIVITPTRELAEQIADELYLLAWNLPQMSMALCIGGASIGNQLSQLRRNPKFVVGTPGRLKDHIERRALDLTKFNSVVLDEVDRMLDMGFINDIKTIIGYLPQNRQSLFFSATVDPKIQQIIRLILKPDHVNVSVKTGDTSANVDQDIVRVTSQEDKFVKLQNLLKQESFKKVLVFMNMKHHVDKIELLLRKAGFRVESLHGDKRQSQRSRAVENFKAGRVTVLLATDVAARGLDISDITHVINYDIPHTYDEYVHRIGRTGRAGKTGIALTFVQGR